MTEHCPDCGAFYNGYDCKNCMLEKCPACGQMTDEDPCHVCGYDPDAIEECPECGSIDTLMYGFKTRYYDEIWMCKNCKHKWKKMGLKRE